MQSSVQLKEECIGITVLKHDLSPRFTGYRTVSKLSNFALIIWRFLPNQTRPLNKASQYCKQKRAFYHFNLYGRETPDMKCQVRDSVFHFEVLEDFFYSITNPCCLFITIHI